MLRFLTSILIIGSVALIATPTPSASLSTQQGEFAPPPPPPPKLCTKRSHYGKVVDVTKTTLTLQCLDILIGGTEWSFSGRTQRIVVGKRVVMYEWRDNVSNYTDPVASGCVALISDNAVRIVAVDGTISAYKRTERPLRKFAASPALAAGGYSCDHGEALSYRLWDVQVGDEVEVEGHSYDGAWRCVAIKILARPGGRVPPSELADKSTLPAGHPRWHETANAYQDWRERGIPLPKDPLPDRPHRPIPPGQEPVGPDRPKRPMLPGDAFPEPVVSPIGND